VGFRVSVLALVLVMPLAGVASQSKRPINAGDSTRSVEYRLQPPPGYRRIAARQGGFGAWIRKLPLRPVGSDVYNYRGQPVSDQRSHVAVLDVDVGEENLQQCADAVIRLRAEYLFSGSCADEIGFNFTSAHAALWKDWRRGVRPNVDGDSVAWENAAAPDLSYANFREYLDTVFMYAGSASLERELLPVEDPAKPEIGDVFIEGGFPGHAVIVLDVAESDDGERIFLLAQSFMPAQDIHVLMSYEEEINPWYRAADSGELITPDWTFSYGDLRRFPQSDCELGKKQH
jgi:hypothetical protein